MKKLNLAASRQLLLALLLDAKRNASMPSNKPNNFLRVPQLPKVRNRNITQVQRLPNTIVSIDSKSCRFLPKIIRTMKKLNSAASRQLLLVLLLDARRNASMPSNKPNNFLRVPQLPKVRNRNITQVQRLPNTIVSIDSKS